MSTQPTQQARPAIARLMSYFAAPTSDVYVYIDVKCPIAATAAWDRVPAAARPAVTLYAFAHHVHTRRANDGIFPPVAWNTTRHARLDALRRATGLDAATLSDAIAGVPSVPHVPLRALALDEQEKEIGRAQAARGIGQ